MLAAIHTVVVIALLVIWIWAMCQYVPEDRCNGDCSKCPFPKCK